MTHNPISGQKLDPRFEYQVINGPTWERLCDGLKYQGIYDHIQIEFTWLRGDGKEQRVTGTVCGIDGTPNYSDTNPTVKFIPDSDCSTYPTPMEISYWPNRKVGVATNTKRKHQLQVS